VGSRLPAVPPHSANSPAVPLPASPQRLSPSKRALASLLVLVGISLVVAKALLWSGGTWNAEVSGYASGTLLITWLGAYVIAGRKKNRKPVVFGLIFAGISFALLLLKLSHPQTDPKARVAALLRETGGTSPMDRLGTFDSPQDKLLREVMTEFLSQGS
jgi:hypothetical protein